MSTASETKPTTAVPFRRDLDRYSLWATQKLCHLAEGLTEADLDAPVPMGFGSLRATLFHLWAAERLWLDRWLKRPWAPLATDPAGLSLAELASRLNAIAAERNTFFDQCQHLGDPCFDQWIEYRNTPGEPFRHRLRDLVLHVTNHAIHHRAQALQMLRRLGRQLRPGLDYLFYRLEYPSVSLDQATVDFFRSQGMAIDVARAPAPRLDAHEIAAYFSYTDWANHRLLNAIDLPDDALDRPFEMGMGTLRKTLTHMADAEMWWWKNWTIGPSPFDRLPATLSLAEIATEFENATRRRNDYVARLTPDQLDQVVEGRFNQYRFHLRVSETMLQLCGHATHHRAQAINMLRQLGVPSARLPRVDFVVWIRDSAAGR